MTDITLGLPIGAFYWRGYIPGSFCGAQIDWECDYSSMEPVAIPPFIDYIGQHVVVTNWLPECESVPSYVSPGVLTLTPTVTCPNPDPEQPPIVTVLDPLYLTITEGGCSTECIPDSQFFANPGFETGDTTDWDIAVGSVVTSPGVCSGTYAFSGSEIGKTINLCLEEEDQQILHIEYDLTAPIGAKIHRHFQWYDSAGTLLGEDDTQKTSGSNPVGPCGTFSDDVVIEGNTAYVVVRWYSIDGDFQVDDFSGNYEWCWYC